MAGLVGGRRRGCVVSALAWSPSRPPPAFASGSGARRRTWSPAPCGSTSWRLATALIAIRRRLRDPARLARARRRRGRTRPARASSRRCPLLRPRNGPACAGAEPGQLLRRPRTALVPLYVLCGSSLRRRESLESGLKYLIVGSLGSATLLYGLALIYGGSGSTDFVGDPRGDRLRPRRRPAGPDRDRAGRNRARLQALDRTLPSVDPGRLPGRPDPGDRVHGGGDQGGRVLRPRALLRGRARPRGRQLAAGAGGSRAVSIVVGNVGALGQDSLKRLLGYSGIAQAGYMLVGSSPPRELGVSALVFYLAAYALMNLAAFCVIVVRERETEFGDDIAPVAGLGRRPSGARLAADDLDAGAGRPAGDGRVHRQALPDRGGRGCRLHLARGGDRDRDDDLARLLPAGGRRRLDAAAAEPLGPEPPRGARRWRAARRRPTPTSHPAPAHRSSGHSLPRDPGSRRGARRGARSSSASSPPRSSTGPRTPARRWRP